MRQPSATRPANDQIETEIGQFGMLPVWVIERLAGQTNGARALQVYAVLAGKYADYTTRRAHPSRETLARVLGCSTKSIDRALRTLVTIGGIAIHKHKDPASRYQSNIYTIRQTNPENRGTKMTTGQNCPLDKIVQNQGTRVSRKPDPSTKKVNTPLPPLSPPLFQVEAEPGIDKAAAHDSTTDQASTTAAPKQPNGHPSLRKPSKAEHEWASRMLSTYRDGCPHDPTCETRAKCIGRLVMFQRQQTLEGMTTESSS